MPEHEVVDDTKVQVGYGEKSADGPESVRGRLLDYHEEALDSGLKARSRFDTIWAENDRFFLRNQWPENRPKWRASPVANFCKSAILPMVALLTDNRPKPEVMPIEPGLNHLAAALGAAVDFVFDDQDFPLLLPQALLTAAINGSGFIGWSHDKWKPNRIQLREIDCYNAFALGGEDIERCSHFWTRDWMSLAQARASYPERGMEVKGEDPDSSPRQRPREALKTVLDDQPTFRVSFGGQLAGRTPSGAVREDGDWNQHGKGAWVWQFYYKDPREAPDGSRYYPTWRHLTIASRVLLADRPIEKEIASGLIPVVKFNNHDWPNEFWGASELHDIKQLNRIYNVVLGLILDLIALGAVPPLLLPRGAGIDPAKLLIRPGMALEVDFGRGEPKWMAPVQITPAMIGILNTIESLVRAMTGSGEISEGALPFKGASGILVSQLREMSQTRIRGKSRNLEVAVKRLGERVMYAIQQFWRLEDTIPLVGELSDEKIARFHPETVEQDPQTRRAFIRVNQIVDVNPSNGEWVRMNDLSQGRFLVKVRGISGMPLTRRSRMVEAMEMVKAGMLDPIGGQEYSDLPEPVMRRYRERMAAAAQAANAQQQAAQAEQAAAGAAGGPAGALGGRPPGPAQGGEPLVLPLESKMGTLSIPKAGGLALPGPEMIAQGGEAARIPI